MTQKVNLLVPVSTVTAPGVVEVFHAKNTKVVDADAFVPEMDWLPPSTLMAAPAESVIEVAIFTPRVEVTVIVAADPVVTVARTAVLVAVSVELPNTTFRAVAAVVAFSAESELTWLRVRLAVPPACSTATLVIDAELAGVATRPVRARAAAAATAISFLDI